MSKTAIISENILRQHWRFAVGVVLLQLTGAGVILACASNAIATKTG